MLNAQEGKVRLPASATTVGEVIRSVEQQTSYVFAYDSKLFDPAKGIRLSGGETDLQTILDAMVAGKNFSYLISGRYIILNPVSAAAKSTVQTIYDDGYRATSPNSLDAAPVSRPVAGEPDPAVQVQPVAEVNIDPSPAYSDYRAPDDYLSIRKNQSLLAAKVNVLYGAVSLTPNLAAEVGLGPKTTLEFYGSYNPWNRVGKLNNNDKLVHWTIRPEARYWFCERFNGHMVGVNAFYSKYNISGHKIPLIGFEKEFRYEGDAYGAGITYGYHLPLGKHWGLEFSAGVGVARMSYEKFDCVLCSGVIEKPSKTYFGPTRMAASLVFMIK